MFLLERSYSMEDIIPSLSRSVNNTSAASCDKFRQKLLEQIRQMTQATRDVK